MTERIAIVGAGIAGLACARRLIAAGFAPVVFDKGRGIGGRLATRRAPDGLRFDHGAQYVTARGPAFATLLTDLEKAGAVARWPGDGAHPRFVGCPGMSGLARALAVGVTVRSGVQVARVVPAETGRWRVVLPDGSDKGPEPEIFDRVVVTAPAPQATALLSSDAPLAARISRARFDPCLTLMAAFPADAPRPFVSQADAGSPLSWIAQDSSKPGRPADGPTAWVAQAAPDWSIEHLEKSPEDIAALMLPLLAARLGVDPGSAVHAVAHRWRYARVSQAISEPFLCNDSRQVYAGGDWCLGPRVEAAWQSGDAIGADIVGQR